VNIGPVTLEFKKEVCGIVPATRPQFDDRPSFDKLSFLNKLLHRNLDCRGLISNDFCTLHRNLVRLVSVTLEFKAKEFVRPASIIVSTLS